MLDQQRVFEQLQSHGVNYYVGVPDSYLNGFCNHALANYPENTVIAANEGNAVAIAAGHYLGQTVLPVTEGRYMRFVHEPDLRTYLYSALITAGFFALVSSTALRRVKNLRLSDIN